MEQHNLCSMFKALSDENRLYIITMLCSGEQCACKLLEELDISQPTLSHHMKVLCDAGLVSARKDGKWTYYSVCDEGVQQMQQLCRSLLAPEHTKPAPGCEEA